MHTKANTSWQEEQALLRYQMIAPLLDESMDTAKRIQLREDIAEKNHEQSRQRRADAISFGSYRKDGGSNV